VGHTLTVSGERIDEDPATEQTLKRSFSRKYSIPTDILLDTIKAHLTDSGLLLIRVYYKKEVDIAVNGFLDAPLPTLYTSQISPHFDYLGSASQLERNGNPNRSSAGRAPSQRRSAKEGKRRANCTRSAPASPVRQIEGANYWSDDDNGYSTIKRTSIETTTRTNIRETSHKVRNPTVRSEQLASSQKAKTISRFNPQKQLPVCHGLSVDTDSSLLSEHEESFI
jgi:hypothetical protein